MYIECILYTYNMKYEYIRFISWFSDRSFARFKMRIWNSNFTLRALQIEAFGLQTQPLRLSSKALDHQRYCAWICGQYFLSQTNKRLPFLFFSFPMRCNLHQTSMNTTFLKKQICHPSTSQESQHATTRLYALRMAFSCPCKLLSSWIGSASDSGICHISRFIRSQWRFKAKLCQDSSFISRFKEPQRHLSSICRAYI